MNLQINKVMVPRPKGEANTLNYFRFDASERFKAGETISSNIRMYRMWWRFVRLGIELEELRIPIGNREVKLNRRFYRQWDLHSIPTLSFDSWWAKHRILFVAPAVKLITRLESIENDYVYLKVPRRKTQTDSIREIRYLLKNKMLHQEPRFALSGRIVPFIRLHMQYNCLVMSINGKSRSDMMDWCNEHYAHIVGVIQQKERTSIREVFGYEQSVSRVLNKARNTLLKAADGVFP